MIWADINGNLERDDSLIFLECLPFPTQAAHWATSNHFPTVNRNRHFNYEPFMNLINDHNDSYCMVVRN